MNGMISWSGEKDAKLTTPMDFMPDWEGEVRKDEVKAPRQSVEEQKRILFAIAKTQKKKAERENNLREKGPPTKRRKR